MKVGLQAWGSEGDIRPFAALASGLVRAGHEVTLVVTDIFGRDYSGIANEFGFHLKTVPVPGMSTHEKFAEIWQQIIDSSNPIRQAEIVMKYCFDPASEAMYQASKTLCATSDLVVGYFSLFQLGVAAEKTKVPYVALSFVHDCFPSIEIPPFGMPYLGKWFYPLGWKLVQKLVNRLLLPKVNALRTKENLLPDSDIMNQTWVSQNLNLVAVSTHIFTPSKALAQSHRVCGFLNLPTTSESRELPHDLSAFLKSGTRPVYFTFGSMMPNNLTYMQNTYSLLLEAVRRSECRAIIQLPWNDLSAFERDPKVLIVNRAPHALVFPHCLLIVHHGGAGTTQSALHAGCPAVVVAHILDQFFWGSELERLGVAGRTQKRKGLKAKKLAKTIQSVLANPEMKLRASELGKKMQREDGIQAAVSWIEAVLK